MTAVLALYEESVKLERYNGVRLEQLDLQISDDQIHLIITDLIRARKLDCLAPPVLNPHIKRHPAPSVDTQLGYLNISEKYHTCLYPSPNIISQSIDLSFLNAKPFSRRLAEGNPQLALEFFEIPVLDRYRQDPRYSFHFNGYVGRMSLSVPEDQYQSMPDRDRVYVESFGLAIDDLGHPVVVAFLRCLSQFTAEHQQYWNSFICHRNAKMHENYYKPTILGEYYTNNSGMAAIAIIVSKIDEICKAIWGHKLFRNELPTNLHYNLTPFMRPTKSDFLIFAHELDKVISENLVKSTIVQMIKKENIAIDIQDTEAGTLKLLERFLFSGQICWTNEAEARSAIIEPLRRLRKLRQPSAHMVLSNEHDLGVYQQRREILGDVVFALGSILRALRTHQRAPVVSLPDWLEAGDIEVL